jgi:hypothetical protein
VKSVELTHDEVVKWMLSGMRLSAEFSEPLEAFAMRNEFPTAEVVRGGPDEDENWRKFLGLDTLDDAVRSRYLSIDLGYNKGATLFYEHTGHWCFEHRRYMTELEDQEKAKIDRLYRTLHYEAHGFTDDSYYKAIDLRGKEVLTHGTEVRNT